MDDRRQALQGRIAGQTLIDELLEGAAALLVSVWIAGSGCVKPIAPSRCWTAATSPGSTKMISAAGSRKRWISQAVAVRLT
jgi:hypothetical protein